MRGLKGFAPLVLIIVIGIVLVAGGLGLGLAWKAGWFGKPGGGPTDGTTNGTQPPPPPSNGAEDGTENGGEVPPPPEIPDGWEIYTSSEANVRFGYPPDWSVSGWYVGGGIAEAIGMYEIGMNYPGRNRTIAGDFLRLTYLGTLSDYPDYSSLEEFLLAGDPAGSIEYVNLGGKVWLRIVHSEDLEHGYNDLNILGNEDRRYGLTFPVLSGDDLEKTVELIISTIEFL